MMSHGHGHCGGMCGHDHDHSDGDLGFSYSLYLKINLQCVQCLNEAVDGSGRAVFKSWDLRKDVTKYVDSDTDAELLFNIPFTGSVKLKALVVMGGSDGQHPDRMRLFKNRDCMTFDDAASQADQEIDLCPDHEGVVEYTTKVARFNNVNHLSIHFPSNSGDDITRIYYIGLKGDFTEAIRQPIVICNYEAKPNPADHTTRVDDSLNFMVS